MHHELAPIFAEAPARRLPSTAAEAVAMYAIRKVETREEAINLCKLIRIEFKKIHEILDDVIMKLGAGRDAEEHASRQQQPDGSKASEPGKPRKAAAHVSGLE